MKMNKLLSHTLPLIKIVSMLCLFFLVFILPGKTIADSDNLPVSAQRVLNRVNLLVEKSEVDQAIGLLASFDGKGADHYLIRFTLGNCYMMTDRHSEANAAYLDAVEKNEHYAPAWYNLAKSYIELDQFSLAGDALNTAYERYESKKPDILYYAASIYFAADQPAKALAVYNRLLSLHPEDIRLDWQQVYARILLANNMPEAALPVIEQLADKMQGDKQKEWQEFLLYQYLALEMQTKALSYARELTQKDPIEPRWWKALTQITLDQDQYKEALVAMTIYGHLTPLSLDEKKLVADLYLMLEIPGQSVKILEQILANTHDTALVEKIVYGYSARHKPEDALKWIEKGLEKHTADIKLLMLKGEVLFQIKQYPESVKTFKAIVNKDKAQGKAWLMMGYSAWYGQDIKTAITAMKQAAKFPRHQKAANEALTGLIRLQKEKS